MSESQVLEIRGLCKAYPAFRLEDVSMSLEEGKITGFIGRNGAGKTTTLKCALGYVHPDAGDIRFFGAPLQGAERRVKQDVGYVSGAAAYYPTKKLRVITGVTRRFYENWDEAAYARCLSDFSLDESKTPAQLSDGMKVKYALALALSHRARLLILDEPTSGLDPVSRDELLDIFLDLQRRGTTILFSTHITSDLDKCADNIIYIHAGRIRAAAGLKEFRSAYRAAALTEEEYASADKGLLIGCKRAKEGYTALVRAEDAPRAAGTLSPADLDTVMIHLEKEGE